MNRDVLFSRRAAGVAVATVGCGSMQLLRPVTAAATDADEIGLGSPDVTQTLLKPVLIETVQGGLQVSVGAEVAEQALGLLGSESIVRSLQDACGALVADARYLVSAVDMVMVYGAVALYRMALQKTETEI